MTLSTAHRPTSSTAGGGRRRATSQARFAARAAAVRRRPWLLAALVAGLLALLAGGVWLVWFSSVLTVREVIVESTGGALPPSVRADAEQRAHVPMGVPLARVDVARIARAVVRQPTLAQATVSRSYPATLVIRLTPRAPVLAVRNPQGEVQLVDRTGSAYDTVTSVSQVPDGVPLVSTTENPPTTETLLSAIAVMRALPAALRQDVTSVNVSGANLVTLKVVVGSRTVTVAWGGGADSELKVRVLSILLRQKGVRTIDVSAPRTPTTA
ncbi:MAG TPA: FtsQ-type POTRA domain-containing protein [Dermatophilaceae bacterium]|nr:FtsQ-type POTRA domain-containing protein [Dermatophilaceae bacterium]